MDWLRTVLTGLGAPLAWLPASVTAALMFALAALVALAFYRTARRLLRRLVADRYPRLLSAVARVHGWVRLALLTLAFALVLPFAPLDPFTRAWLAKLLLIATITLVGWAAIVALRIAADLYLRRFQLETADNLLARKHVTQVRVLQRTADILVIIVTLGAAAFSVFLYLRLIVWWWDWIPHYLFFLIVAMISITLLAAFRRVRARV